MNFLRFLVSFLSVVVVVKVTAQQIELPLGDIDAHVANVFINVESTSARIGSGVYPYSRLSDGPLRSFIDSKLREMTLDPDADATDVYAVQITAKASRTSAPPSPMDRVGSTRERQFLPLKRTQTGFELSPEAYNYDFQYSGTFDFLYPGIQGYVVTIYTPSGPKTFSTELTGRNDFPDDSGCDRGSIRGNITQGIFTISSGIVMAEWERLELVVQTTSGPKKYEFSRTAVSPPRVTSIRKDGNDTYVSVQGQNGSNVSIQWKPTLDAPWQEISEPRQYRLLSDGPITFAHTCAHSSGFYRAVQQAPTVSGR